MRTLNDIEIERVSGASIILDSWDKNYLLPKLADWYQRAIDITADAMCSASGKC